MHNNWHKMTDEQHENTQVSKQELRTSVTLKDNLMHRFVQWLEDNDLAPHQGLKICIISQLSNYANSLRATTSSLHYVSSNFVISKEIMRKPQERKKTVKNLSRKSRGVKTLISSLLRLKTNGRKFLIRDSLLRS